MPGPDPLLDGIDPGVQFVNQRHKRSQGVAGLGRNAVIRLVLDDLRQTLEFVQTLGLDDAEFREVGAYGVGQGGALANQQIAAAVQRQDRLLLDGLDRDKAHARPPNRFADRFGIGGVVLVALYVGFDVLRRELWRNLGDEVIRRRSVMSAR